jgi:hypothetical protein
MYVYGAYLHRQGWLRAGADTVPRNCEEPRKEGYYHREQYYFNDTSYFVTDPVRSNETTDPTITQQ